MSGQLEAWSGLGSTLRQCMRTHIQLKAVNVAKIGPKVTYIIPSSTMSRNSAMWFGEQSVETSSGSAVALCQCAVFEWSPHPMKMYLPNLKQRKQSQRNQLQRPGLKGEPISMIRRTSSPRTG